MRGYWSPGVQNEREGMCRIRGRGKQGAGLGEGAPAASTRGRTSSVPPCHPLCPVLRTHAVLLHPPPPCRPAGRSAALLYTLNPDATVPRDSLTRLTTRNVAALKVWGHRDGHIGQEGPMAPSFIDSVVTRSCNSLPPSRLPPLSGSVPRCPPFGPGAARHRLAARCRRAQLPGPTAAVTLHHLGP